ncbi:MAG TPA: hypothetical protein VKG86_10585 [Terracidiphilus sp.]|nr:hypothetical protein [Terracidiphilus sp.]
MGTRRIDNPNVYTVSDRRRLRDAVGEQQHQQLVRRQLPLSEQLQDILVAENVQPALEHMGVERMPRTFATGVYRVYTSAHDFS